MSANAFKLDWCEILSLGKDLIQELVERATHDSIYPLTIKTIRHQETFEKPSSLNCLVTGYS